jgi:hypothetical protein
VDFAKSLQWLKAKDCNEPTRQFGKKLGQSRNIK